MNKQLFLSIADRIEAAVPAFRWIDFDDGAIDIQAERPALAFPACLLDISYPDTEDESGTEQLVNAAITLRVAFQPAGATNNHSPVRENALANFDTIAALHTALQGWNDTGLFSKLSRHSALRERRRDGLIVYRITYRTTFIE
jgi:hypothetical protein